MPEPDRGVRLSWASAAAFRRYFWQPPKGPRRCHRGTRGQLPRTCSTTSSTSSSSLRRPGHGRRGQCSAAWCGAPGRLGARRGRLARGHRRPGRRNGLTRDTSAGASESMIERFDLFTIIVLGEVVVGVVNGIADAGRAPIAVVTGVLGLAIGFAYWWSYFDFVGGRRVRSERGALSRWLRTSLRSTGRCRWRSGWLPCSPSCSACSPRRRGRRSWH